MSSEHQHHGGNNPVWSCPVAKELRGWNAVVQWLMGGVDSISFGCLLHTRRTPMGVCRTCSQAGEIKKTTRAHISDGHGQPLVCSRFFSRFPIFHFACLPACTLCPMFMGVHGKLTKS